MSDPTARALAAYRRSNPTPPADPPAGCYVDLEGIPERDRPGLVLAVREMVGRWRVPPESATQRPAETAAARSAAGAGADAGPEGGTGTSGAGRGGEK